MTGNIISRKTISSTAETKFSLGLGFNQRPWLNDKDQITITHYTVCSTNNITVEPLDIHVLSKFSKTLNMTITEDCKSTGR